MKRHEIKLRIARIALEVASGKDVLTVAAEYDCREETVRDACKKYSIDPPRPATVGRKTKLVSERRPEFIDLVEVMEQFCETNIEHLGRHDLLLINQLAKQLENRLIARGQA